MSHICPVCEDTMPSNQAEKHVSECRYIATDGTICQYCEERGITVEMAIEDTISDFHDPSAYAGHGQETGQVYVCHLCEKELELV